LVALPLVAEPVAGDNTELTWLCIRRSNPKLDSTVPGSLVAGQVVGGYRRVAGQVVEGYRKALLTECIRRNSLKLDSTVPGSLVAGQVVGGYRKVQPEHSRHRRNNPKLVGFEREVK
jgi:hypothetical protein